jgi:putative transposase
MRGAALALILSSSSLYNGFYLEVMLDYVHLLVQVDPQFGIHWLVRLLKGRSSQLLRQEFPRLKSRLPTLWTNSYFVSTTGGAPVELVKRYIEGQQRG